jgi:hypothetical protein
MLTIYFVGSLWLTQTAKITFRKAPVIGVLPFVPGDTIKILLAAMEARNFYQLGPCASAVELRLASTDFIILFFLFIFFVIFIALNCCFG